jgi:hypothetical protein
MGSTVLTDAHYDWVAAVLGVDVRKHSGTASTGSAAVSGKASAPARSNAKAPTKPAPQQPDDGPLVFNGTIKKVPSDPDDPFSPEVDVADLDMPTLPEPMPKVRPHNDVIVKYLQDIPEFASGRAVSYCQAVAEACEGFEKYTKKRIKELTKPSFGTEELFGALIGVVATVATGGLGGEALEGLGKLVAEGVKDAIKDAVKEQGQKFVKKAGGEESKADELESMAEQIATSSRRNAARVKDTVVANISERVDPLITKLENGQKLTQDEDKFILPFAAADSAGKDRLYRKLGVPDLTAAKSVKLNLFGKMVWAFEDKVWEDKTKDDIAKQKDWLDHTDSEEEKAHARRNIEELEEQTKHNARATAHNAWGKFKEENT